MDVASAYPRARGISSGGVGVGVGAVLYVGSLRPSAIRGQSLRGGDPEGQERVGSPCPLAERARRVTFGPLATTLMAGSEDDMTQERIYLAHLSSVDSYEVDSDELRLIAEGLVVVALKHPGTDEVSKTS